jgi:hypothetical protein
MPWTIGWDVEPEADLIREILGATGKALYLSNRFEAKCKGIVRIANLWAMLDADPVATLVEVASRLPPEKMLGSVLADLFTHPEMGVTQQECAALIKAKDARNWLAHEGAATLGDLYGYDVQRMLDALRMLRIKVSDLVAGDSIVSAWEYMIEEPGEPLPAITRFYAELVDDWIFGGMPTAWLDPSWRSEREPLRTLRDRIGAINSYRPFYLVLRDGTLHEREIARRRRAGIQSRLG